MFEQFKRHWEVTWSVRGEGFPISETKRYWSEERACAEGERICIGLIAKGYACTYRVNYLNKEYT